MNDTRFRWKIAGPAILSVAAYAGCGGKTPEVAKKEAPAKTEETKAAPAPTVAAVPVTKPAPATETKPAKKTGLNPFQMPDIPEEFLPPKEESKPVEPAASVKQFERPRLRLLGFANVDGFKALVESKGDVQAVSAGDTIEGAQVISIEPPNVTFQFSSSRWATKLFDQPWHNEQSGLVSSPGASRTFAAQSRSTPRTNTLASTSRTTPAAAMRGPAGPSMIGANLGVGIPGIGGGNAMPAIPGMPSGDGSSSSPGLGSIPGMPSAGAPGGSGMPGGAGVMPGGTGAMPVGAGAMPSGAGAMPGGAGAMPGGAGAIPGGAGAMPSGGLPGGPPN